MKSIGFDLEKGAIRFCCLEGTFQNPSLLYKEKRPLNPNTPIPEYMDRFESFFSEFLTKYSPERIGYRLVMPMRKEQVYNLVFPYAILNLLAKKNDILIYEYVKQNFAPSKFALTKGVNLYEHCDKVFGVNSPHWDIAQKNAILSAWLSMKG